MNLLCPTCNGGRTGEKSLGVWVTNGATYGRCYRASCGWYGRFDGEVPVSLARSRARTQREPLSLEQEAYLIGRVGSKASSRLHAFSVGSRIGLPIYSPQGEDVGYTAKAVDGTKPKALTCKDDRSYGLGSWYNGGRRVVLVEDQLSAACVAAYTEHTGVALLGCQVSEPLVRHLCSASRPTAICLDQDATRLAVEQALRWRGVLDLEVVPLKGLDLKDRQPEEIRYTLKETSV